MKVTPIFGIFDDTSLLILPKTHDPSLRDTPEDLYTGDNHIQAKQLKKVPFQNGVS